MKAPFMRFVCGLLIVAMAFLFGTLAQADSPVRPDMRKINSAQDQIQDLANADHQVTLDTLCYVRIAKDSSYTTKWYPLQVLSAGYPNIMTCACRVYSGALAIRTETFYSDTIPAARHADSTHWAFTPTSPLTVGQWDFPLAIYGGLKWRAVFTAIGDSAKFHPQPWQGRL